MGGEVTEDFWDDLEDTLVGWGDMGAEVAGCVSPMTCERAARESYALRSATPRL